MKTFTKILLGAICFGLITIPLKSYGGDSITLKTNYDNMSDNDGFTANQIQNEITHKNVVINHVFLDAIQGTQKYNYHIGTVGYKFIGSNWSALIGPGIISTSEGTTTYGYVFLGKYKLNDQINFELSADRSTVMGSATRDFGQKKVVDYMSDNVTLSGEYQATEALSISGGVLAQQFSDGNSRHGFVDKIHYQITDKFGVQMRNKILWTDFKSTEYFSPKERQEHWFMGTYTQPLFGDKVAFKFAAGPGKVKIDDVSASAWIVESKIYGYISNDVRLEGHLNCSTSTYDYRYCMVGIQLDFKF